VIQAVIFDGCRVGGIIVAGVIIVDLLRIFVRREVRSRPDSSSFWQSHKLQRLMERLTRCPGSSYHDTCSLPRHL
jgi:hypothetical protein